MQMFCVKKLKRQELANSSRLPKRWLSSWGYGLTYLTCSYSQDAFSVRVKTRKWWGWVNFKAGYCMSSYNFFHLLVVCDYHVHAECQDGALPNCRQASTYTPGWTLEEIRPTHYWREGNLPTGAKCILCRKSCWSAECLAGWKCEWCGLAVKKITF